MSITARKALLSGKCPACHQGDIFVYPAQRITHFAEMHKACPHCGTSFEREPGFYFGAMYITYAFNVGLVGATALFTWYVVSLPEVVNLVVIAVLAVIVTPFSFRASRVLWLYWFGGLTYKQ